MTKRIELTQGKYALVDDDMYDELNHHEWHAIISCNTFYAQRSSPQVNNKRYGMRMHRQILGLVYNDGKITDHINRNGLDNRRCNLRISNHVENGHNHGGYSTNTSGYTGVHWYKSRKKWRARIRVNYKEICLGYYDNIDDAILARQEAELNFWKGDTPDDPDIRTGRTNVLPSA